VVNWYKFMHQITIVGSVWAKLSHGIYQRHHILLCDQLEKIYKSLFPPTIHIEPENSNASNITRIDSEKFRTIVVIITLSKLKP
jgi:hypothetical protein